MSSSNTQPHESVKVATVSRPEKPSWQIKLLYDGECPLCVREVNFLRKRDAGQGRVKFVDIADDDYTPSLHGGVDFETAMGRIHAVLPDGTVIKNVEVFRRVYEILGMGWIYAATKLPVIGLIVDILYEIWADWRLALTGRPDLATIISDRQNRIECKTLQRCRLTDDDD
ncbi:MAG TPA: thiol-disulfide oxidoreductase [Cyanobacteria bacterium UBA8553]|nr:thiol-disulfide oxidoreductase [Cyanobacteria bacterium UBA8553]HAJ60956.1 thiol-disulfide oxidoreductase [Cyanobacteria bacterium UBA8543]